MASVLTTGSSVGCNHGAVVTPLGTPKLTAAGNPVLLRGQVNSWTFAPTCAQTTQGQVKCAAVLSVTGGVATKLTVGGDGALLNTFGATTNGKPDASMSVSSNQAKLNAV